MADLQDLAIRSVGINVRTYQKTACCAFSEQRAKYKIGVVKPDRRFLNRSCGKPNDGTCAPGDRKNDDRNQIKAVSMRTKARLPSFKTSPKIQRYLRYVHCNDMHACNASNQLSTGQNHATTSEDIVDKVQNDEDPVSIFAVSDSHKLERAIKAIWKERPEAHHTGNATPHL
ncbi:hypothetical protein KCU61_g644, partial [Aureobasidium melanogenum]